MRQVSCLQGDLTEHSISLHATIVLRTCMVSSLLLRSLASSMALRTVQRPTCQCCSAACCWAFNIVYALLKRSKAYFSKSSMAISPSIGLSLYMVSCAKPSCATPGVPVADWAPVGRGGALKKFLVLMVTHQKCERCALVALCVHRSPIPLIAICAVLSSR